MAGAPKSDLYTEADFVQVQDAEGRVQTDLVPKTWLGTDLLPAGWVKATAKTAATTTTTDPQPPSVPAKSETREVLEAYAVEHGGMTVEQSKAFATKDDLHAELVKASSGS